MEATPLQQFFAKKCPDTKLSYVIVSKRINSKFMLKPDANKNVVSNPQPGTVIDDVVVCTIFQLNNIRLWPDWAIVCTLGNHSKPVATIIFPKSPTLLGNFYKDVKIIHFSSEIIFGQFL